MAWDSDALREQARNWLIKGPGDGPAPNAVGEKFGPDGNALVCPGNTTLCHLDPAEAAHRAITALQARLRDGPLAHAFAFLPPDSFHMTVFDGVIASDRARPGWPAHLPIETEIDAVTDDLLPRLRAAQGFERVTVRPVGLLGGFSLLLTGATDADETTLRAMRDRLSDATGIRRDNHLDYPFHLTLAYPIRWMTEAEAQSVIDLSETLFATLIATVPSFQLGPVEICRFETMHHFETLGHVGAG